MEAQFDQQGRERNLREGNISPLGGVRTNWDKDYEVMFKKLNQLPDRNLGVVLLLDRFVGVDILPWWWEKIPANKCVVKLNHTSYDAGFENVYGEAVVYHSDNFKEMDEVRKMIDVIGFSFKAENIP